MIHVSFVVFCLVTGLTVSSSLRILNKRLDCNQQGLDNCEIENCTESMRVENKKAPISPEWEFDNMGVWMDEHEPLSVVNVTWRLKADASLFKLQGSEINIVDETTNESLCVNFSFRINQVVNPSFERWKFSLEGLVVEPWHTYTLSLFNFPEPKIEPKRITKQIVIPGCGDVRIQKSLQCLQNGSLWDPHINTNVSFNQRNKELSVIVGFEAAQYSEKYRVSIQNDGLYYSKNISKENRTLLSVTFKLRLWELSQCELLLTVQPYFIRCKNDCLQVEKKLNYCLYFPRRMSFKKPAVGLFVVTVFLGLFISRTPPKEPVNTSVSAAEEQPESFKVLERKRVLIIYSSDHPLYKNIVLKLSAFLVSKCGTEVILDLLDSTRLGVLGSIQWLDLQRQQIEKSSDKILILCSKGVQAKWKAMCGGKKVFLREDARSPAGDMLSPALSLIVPHFIRSTSFEKYIVAYFDAADVPSPFHITVRYKLMEQFEELLFRILNAEKQKPGSINYIQGISEGEYHHCPSGRNLQDAIEAFQMYQLQHPQWFEDELLESSELDEEESSAEEYQGEKNTQTLFTISDPDSTKVIELLHNQERKGLHKSKEHQTFTTAEVKSEGSLI